MVSLCRGAAGLRLLAAGTALGADDKKPVEAAEAQRSE
jgi:hypothetical protein